jgi:hypothetical protein
MNPTERQQSLAAAREAAEWLREYMFWKGATVQLRENVAHLIDGFALLDAKEQKQTQAARNNGHFGALGGWKKGKPRKTNGGKR